jgi:hypothetical protein
MTMTPQLNDRDPKREDIKQKEDSRCLSEVSTSFYFRFSGHCRLQDILPGGLESGMEAGGLE